jgi:hypothetical protein
MIVTAIGPIIDIYCLNWPCKLNITPKIIAVIISEIGIK